MSGHCRCYEKNWRRRGLSPLFKWQIFGQIFGVLIALISAGCKEEILHDLSEREANKVVSHLSLAALDADKVLQADGRWTISVESDQMVSAITHLDTQRVLTVQEPSAYSGKSSIIPSREEQRFRFERALAASLEGSLLAIPGVLEARVHINVAEQDPLFVAPDSGGGSGSVLLVITDSFASSDEEVAALVAGAAGLDRKVVQVLKTRASRIQSHTQSRAAQTDGDNKVPNEESVPSISAYMVWVILAVVSMPAVVLGIRRYRRYRVRRSVRFSAPGERDLEQGVA